jgi:hypothetical protein
MSWSSLGQAWLHSRDSISFSLSAHSSSASCLNRTPLSDWSTRTVDCLDLWFFPAASRCSAASVNAVNGIWKLHPTDSSLCTILAGICSRISSLLNTWPGIRAGCVFCPRRGATAGAGGTNCCGNSCKKDAADTARIGVLYPRDAARIGSGNNAREVAQLAAEIEPRHRRWRGRSVVVCQRMDLARNPSDCMMKTGTTCARLRCQMARCHPTDVTCCIGPPRVWGRRTMDRKGRWGGRVDDE